MAVDVIKYYRRLFKLPSLGLILVMHIVLGLVCGLYMEGFNLKSVLNGFIVFTLTSLLTDLAVRLICEDEPLLKFRRVAGLSLFSNATVLTVSLLFKPLTLLGFSIDRVLVAGFPVSLALRLMVFRSLLFKRRLQFLSIAQPLTCILALTYVYHVSLYPSLPAALLTSFLTIYIYLKLINDESKPITGFSGLTLLRAFLASWMEGLNEPIEEVFEKLGEEDKRHVDILAFKTQKSKTAIIVPYIHPGPFRNVGSSSLPWSIQTLLENQVGFEAVAVPHGTSTHSCNLVSISYISKVLDALRLFNLKFNQFKASKFVRASQGSAKALCQVFENIAFVVLTLAPDFMEDISPEVKEVLEKYGKSLGFKSVVVVDAHNSFSWSISSMSDESNSALIKVGKAALYMASKVELKNFKVGFSRSQIKGYGVKDGVGPGGVAVHLFMVDDDLYAYVTIDGNNMVSGLREKIIQCLKSMGVSDSEVLTTDTHMVNATILNRGYHPIGEAVDENYLLNVVSDAFKEAYSRLDWAVTCYKRVEVDGLKILGSSFSRLIRVLEVSAKKAKGLAFKLMTPMLLLCTLLTLL